MRNLLLFIRRYYPFFLFLFLEIVSFILISGSNTYHHSTFVNSSNVITGKTFELKNNVTHYFGLRQVNANLEEENAALRKMISNMGQQSEEGWVDSLGKDIYTYQPVKVINHSTSKKYNYFTIDQGSKDGITKDLGVIDAKGLVGVITNTSPNYSVGQSMLNINRRTSVKHKKTNAIGRMRWQGNHLMDFIVEDITKTAKVQIGDTIITSGYSTYYPEGITVGVVTESILKEGSNFYDIKVALSNDILSIDNVYVIQHAYKVEIDSLEEVPE